MVAVWGVGTEASRPRSRPAIALSLLAVLSCTAQAGDREQAKHIHDRIAGVPPSASVLADMEADVANGDAIQAAYTAMENPAFYDATLKHFVAPWTNEERSAFVALNDYTATVIGAIRDELDFRRVLFDDLLYVGASNLGLPAYSISNNAHYEALENNSASLKTALTQVAQSSRNGLPPGATAGIHTTRAAAKAFFIAGTNRAMFRFTLLNHLCNDLEQVNDTTRPPDRVRQDVSRSPGGDSRIFLNSCVGCHSGMDPMTQAFAYYDYDYDADNDPDGLAGQLVYNAAGTTDPDTGSRVQGKYLINSGSFSFGYVTPDDQWNNYWRSGPNQLLGWSADLSGSGSGAKSMAQELAYSEAFAQCQVKKVFRNVCLRDPVDSADRSQIDSMVSSFGSHQYNLKQVFAESAAYCMGN